MIALRVRRPVAASLLVAATDFAALLPPAHIHLAAHDDHDHDHAAAIEHSHWTPHHHSHTAFDDEDGRVLYVDHPALVRASNACAQHPGAVIVAVLILTAAPACTSTTRRLAGNAPRDGPTRHSLSLRAPPLLV